MLKHIGWVVVFIAIPALSTEAVEMTGRFSMLSTSAYAKKGDFGYDGENRALSADQESLRIMLDNGDDNSEWSFHLKNRRQHFSGYPTELSSTQLFRYRRLDDKFVDNCRGDSCTHIGYEVDRLFYKRLFHRSNISLGRQAIDWGSGRFWQPLNVFGAFAPTDLDTDFKPGIDAATFDWYPSAFSSLTAAYVFSPEDDKQLEDSGAIHYRRQVGEESEMALLAGLVIGNAVVGGSFESTWNGMGWRFEGTYYQLEKPKDETLFTTTGVDYQFDNGTLVIAEWYHNSRGADSESALAKMQFDQLVVYGLQQHLSRDVLGIGVQKDLTPLLRGSYTLLISTVNRDQRSVSSLHQMNLTYSVSDESDLLLSAFIGTGAGINSLDEVRSEFGYLPASVTARLRFYF